MFKISNIGLYVLSTIIFLSLDMNIALSQKQYSKEEIIKNARTIYMDRGQKSCFFLKSIKLEEAGFVTLHFKHNTETLNWHFLNSHSKYCPD